MPYSTKDLEELILQSIRQNPMKPSELVEALDATAEQVGLAIQALINRREAAPDLNWKLKAM